MDRDSLNNTNEYSGSAGGNTNQQDGFVQLLRAYEEDQANGRISEPAAAGRQTEDTEETYNEYLNEGYGEYTDAAYRDHSYAPDYEDVSSAWRQDAAEDPDEQAYAAYVENRKKPGRKRRRPPRMVTFGILCLCIVLAAVTGALSSIAVMQHYTADTGSEPARVQPEGTHAGMGAICSTIVEANTLGTADGNSQTVTADVSDADTAQQTTTNASVIKSIMDSVVCIKTEMTVDTFYGPMSAGGAGSGVIISEDGYIVTCAHVVSGASKIEVQDSENNTYEAALLASNNEMDLALLKIDASGLIPAVLGDSDSYSAGDQIYVVGNPLGNFVLSVSQGIISGLDRQANIDGNMMRLTQVDAAVNPGNSGGGLFDGQGRLIGIVNAKNTGIDVEGMGFAIPIDTVRDVLRVMMQRTKLEF